MKLYHSISSPNSRRVRIYLAEKGLSIPLVAVDLGKGEQHSDAYRAINPRRVVPTLVLEDGTPIGEVPAICRYIEETLPTPPLLGETAKEKAQVSMWDRRAELEGVAAVMEAIRNSAPGLKGRAIAGPHDYEQIPELAERSKLRVKNFFADFDNRLGEAPFMAGQSFSVADITALVTVDFAAKAINFPVPGEHPSLKRWYDGISSRPAWLRSPLRSPHRRRQENEMSQSREAKNKALVLEAFDTLFNKRNYAAAERFWSSNYIQHSAHIEPGREGLFNLIKGTPASLKYEPGVIVAEGDLVIVHGRFSGTGRPRNWIAADIVRIADGVLAEHWDVLQDEVARAVSKSGLPMFGDRFAD